MNIRTITSTEPQYPELLGEIASPPKQLHILGDMPKSDMPLVAIIGSRKPTRYGRAITESLSAECAKAGIGVVSGLALGIDAIAHRSALEAGGYTLAVMACGLDRLYPASNRQLAIRILKNDGAIISEYEQGTPPLKQHFPARNRIITGLCHGVIVTEAAQKSGSLISAGFGLEQNRTVMAVPGNATSALSEGTNNLIKAGAVPVTSGEDILFALGLESLEHTSPSKPRSEEEAQILALIDEGLHDGDEMLARLKWDVADFQQTITLMEISGSIRRIDGNRWVRM